MATVQDTARLLAGFLVLAGIVLALGIGAALLMMRASDTLGINSSAVLLGATLAIPFAAAACSAAFGSARNASALSDGSRSHQASKTGNASKQQAA